MENPASLAIARRATAGYPVKKKLNPGGSRLSPWQKFLIDKTTADKLERPPFLCYNTPFYFKTIGEFPHAADVRRASCIAG